MSSEKIMMAEKQFYRVLISRELHVYAGSDTEAMVMAQGAEQYSIPKVTAEVMDPPPNEAEPL